MPNYLERVAASGGRRGNAPEPAAIAPPMLPMFRAGESDSTVSREVSEKEAELPPTRSEAARKPLADARGSVTSSAADLMPVASGPRALPIMPVLTEAARALPEVRIPNETPVAEREQEQKPILVASASANPADLVETVVEIDAPPPVPLMIVPALRTIIQAPAGLRPPPPREQMQKRTQIPGEPAPELRPAPIEAPPAVSIVGTTTLAPASTPLIPLHADRAERSERSRISIGQIDVVVNNAAPPPPPQISGPRAPVFDPLESRLLGRLRWML